MTYQQVKTILERVRAWHRLMRDRLEEARPRVRDPRIEFLLDRFGRDEQQMNVALAKYENSGQRAILETWIQYVPDEELRRLMQDVDFDGEISPEALMEHKTRFDEELVNFYRQLSGETSVPGVVDLFSALARLTEQRIENEAWESRESELAPGEDRG